MARRAKSISRQLLISLGLTMLVFWLVASALAYEVMKDEMGEIFDSSLQETAERLAPLVINDLFAHDDSGQAPRQITALRENIPDEYLTYQVRDQNGRVLLHSHNVGPEPYEAPLKDGFWNGEHQRIFTASAVSGTIFVQVADSLDHRQEAAMEGGGALLLPLVFLLPVSLLVIAWLVRRNVGEVDRLRSVIAFRDSGNLVPLDLKDLPVELEPIQQSVNLLIHRVSDALEAERTLTANSAHELRTPLAGAMAQSQLLVSELPEGAARDRAKQVDASLHKLSSLTEKLLQLARADAGIGRAEQKVDLSHVADLVVDEFTRAEPDNVEIRYDAFERAGLMRAANPDAFGIALRNLLENALKYGEQGHPVEVALIAEGVRVTNLAQRKGLLPVEQLRQRFVRGNSTSPGSGLGLAIVDRLAQHMGARLDLHWEPVDEARVRFSASLVFITVDA